MMLSDELIVRLCESVADPKTRADGLEAMQLAEQPKQIQTKVATLDEMLGGGGGADNPLAGMMRMMANTLFSGGKVNPQEMAEQVVSDTQSVKIAPEEVESFARGPAGILHEDGTRSETPRTLPPPASEADFAAVEAALGVTLPAELRQLYGSVANGGFGPNAGLGTLAAIAARYRGLRAAPVGEGGQSWPAHLLPIGLGEPGADCYDLQSGEIVYWDEERLADGPGEEVWNASFQAVADSLADWLEQWLAAEPRALAHERQMEDLKRAEIKRSLDHWRAMSPEERAEYGLPEKGWEEELFGHLGIDLKSL